MAGTALLSCGVLLFNEHDQLLLAHATGNRHWDVPKGLADPGEAPLAAALRETWRKPASSSTRPAGWTWAAMPTVPARTCTSSRAA